MSTDVDGRSRCWPYVNFQRRMSTLSQTSHVDVWRASTSIDVLWQASACVGIRRHALSSWCTSTQLRTSTHVDVRRCTLTSIQWTIHFHRPRVHLRPSTSSDIHRLTSTYDVQRTMTYVDVHRRPSRYVEICRCMSTSVDLRQHTSTYIEVCRRASTYVTSSSHVEGLSGAALTEVRYRRTSIYVDSWRAFCFTRIGIGARLIR